jgi:hypothetical protein
MSNTKKRRDVEVYENYWKFTAAHLDITGTKFNNCLNVIVLFIDKNKEALAENAKNASNFSECKLYGKLQQKIVDISGFKGNDATLSARKVINQFVKIGFVYPFLLGYHPLVKSFIHENNKEKKAIIFSKIFYESSSLASDVTVDNRSLKHVNFLLKTLDKNGSLTKNDIMALMVTDISNYSAGYLTREQLDSQYKYAVVSEFDDRKYNQIGHLIGYLKRFVDLKYDKNEERFWFADDPQIADKDFDESFARDGVKHRIYKDELKEESKILYGDVVCYLDKKPYKSLIASHIKPCVDCLKEHREDQAYDVDNGILLSPTADSYFGKKDISFNDDGRILIGKGVADAVRVEFEKYSLDEKVLNDRRKMYLAYHRELFEKKNGGNNGGI